MSTMDKDNDLKYEICNPTPEACYRIYEQHIDVLKERVEARETEIAELRHHVLLLQKQMQDVRDIAGILL